MSGYRWQPSRTQRLMGWRHWPNVLAAVALAVAFIATWKYG